MRPHERIRVDTESGDKTVCITTHYESNDYDTTEYSIEEAEFLVERLSWAIEKAKGIFDG